MSRPRLSEEERKARKYTGINISARVPSSLAAAWNAFCKSNGISSAKALERLIVNTLVNKRIPGIEPINYEELNAQMPFSHTKPAKGDVNSTGKVLFE